MKFSPWLRVSVVNLFVEMVMSELITIESSQPIQLPEPRVAIEIRVATVDDLAFIDALQKKQTKQVGFMPTKQLEGKIAAGHVLVAESLSPRRHGDTEKTGSESSLNPIASSVSPCLRGERVGYLIGCDRYFKRDDVGIIYAINIVPEFRRSLVAAALLKAQFERSAYGCRLYCCWCAQDIEANRFWESMGFVPLAFRAGSEKKSRVHIFWQKRIRAGDVTTAWWFPAKTDAGSLREDRLVLPIPQGVHWSDEMPRILPTATPAIEDKQQATKTRTKTTRDTSGPVKCGPRQFNGPPPLDAPTPVVTAVETPKKPVKQKLKADPRMIGAARELRDRYLEQVNAEASPVIAAKYDVSRAIAHVALQKLLAA